jgi:hypothetical protein
VGSLVTTSLAAANTLVITRTVNVFEAHLQDSACGGNAFWWRGGRRRVNLSDNREFPQTARFLEDHRDMNYANCAICVVDAAGE